MDSIGAFLDSQPFITLFLVVALGFQPRTAARWSHLQGLLADQKTAVQTTLLKSPVLTPSRRITILLFALARPLTHPRAHVLPV
jgi:hypothetical protein